MRADEILNIECKMINEIGIYYLNVETNRGNKTFKLMKE
jgi:hypothetical protein